jgi:succinate dehydrogenase / fumarate reductase, flavoprotein subunit
LAFGRAAGRSAAATIPGPAFDPAAAAPSLALATAIGPACNTAALFAALQAVMADKVGPFRTAAGLDSALAEIRALREAAGTVPPGAPGAHDLARLDWFDLRHGLLVAEAIILSAQARTESRGAHQREDFPGMDEAWTLNQTLELRDGALRLGRQVPA